jgi:hypothetical protein
MLKAAGSVSADGRFLKKRRPYFEDIRTIFQRMFEETLQILRRHFRDLSEILCRY